MTDQERTLIERWIIENVNSDDVPSDEGNTEALVYNLVHKLREGKSYRRYRYEQDQDIELTSLGVGQ